MDSPANRRRYPRLSAPVFYRPAGPAFLHHRRATINLSAGGMRVYTDDELVVGARLDIELMLSGENTVHCWAQVTWIDRLPSTAGAAYDVGLKFLDMSDDDRRLVDDELRR